MLITKAYEIEFDRYIDVYVDFEIKPSNLHYEMFSLFAKNQYEKYGNENLREIEVGKFTYFNHCVKSEIVITCVHQLLQIKNGRQYPTKDVEGIVYKIIQTLELFSN